MNQMENIICLNKMKMKMNKRIKKYRNLNQNQ